MLSEEEELRRAAWRAVSEAGCLSEIAEEIRLRKGWRCSQRTAESIVSKWLSPDERRPLPAYVLALIIRHTGRDEFTPVLLRAGMAAREREELVADEPLRGPVKVPPRRRRGVA